MCSAGLIRLRSGNLTGTTQAPVPALIVPYVEQMSDTASGSVDYQVGRDSMLGGGASYSTFSFPNPAAAAGLSNSDGEGGSAFYSRRFSGKQYGGLSYNYSRDVVTDAPYAPFNDQVHSLLPFYSIYFNPRFSVSISAGIQHIGITQQFTTQTYRRGRPPVARASGGKARGEVLPSAIFIASILARASLKPSHPTV